MQFTEQYTWYDLTYIKCIFIQAYLCYIEIQQIEIATFLDVYSDLEGYTQTYHGEQSRIVYFRKQSYIIRGKKNRTILMRTKTKTKTFQWQPGDKLPSWVQCDPGQSSPHSTSSLALSPTLWVICAHSK